MTLHSDPNVAAFSTVAVRYNEDSALPVPANGAPVLVLNGYGDWEVMTRYADDDDVTWYTHPNHDLCDDPDYEVVAWMPLPPADILDNASITV